MSHDADDSSTLVRQKEEFIESFFRRGAEFTRELLSENARLRERVAELEAQVASASAGEAGPSLSQLMAQYSEIEQENHDLASLFVAQSQLHSSLDVSEVVAVIVEVLLNFVGADRFALLLLDGDGALRWLARHGFQGATEAAPLPRTGLVADALESGRVCSLGLDGTDLQPERDPPRVVIPLRESGGVVGVVSIWTFLEQKVQMQPVDHRIFDLLADHAGHALEAARVAASASARAGNPYDSYAPLLS